MANENTAYAVPDFKVARVGKERKKRSGFAWFKAPAKPGSWVGLAGGTGSGAVSTGGTLGLGFAKTMLAIALTSGIGAGAITMGRHAAMSRANAPQVEKPSIFAKSEPIQLEGDTSNLPSTPNSMPNSLGYVSGSPDGLTPEERAKLAAEAEAKKQAEEEAARKAEEEAAAGDQTAQNPMDPAAMMAAAQEGGEKKGSPFGKKFGALSSSFGGQSSLSGGAGLSAGVARNFGSANMGGPRGKGGQLGNMGGVGSRVKMAGASRKRVSPSNVKGFARRQLANANALSRRGMSASRGESAAYDASSAFDNNDGAGNVITGAGIGAGGGAGEGKPDTPNALNNGGPTGGGAQGEDCGGSAYYDPNTGTCAPLKTPNKKSANVLLDTLAMIAQGLLMTITVLCGIAAVAQKTLFGAMMSEPMRIAIGAIGAIIAVLGVAIIAMGDYAAGTIFTLVGGFIGIACWGPFESLGALTSGGGILSAAAGMLLGQASKMLAPQSK
jgi:hypothetical protein